MDTTKSRYLLVFVGVLAMGLLASCSVKRLATAKANRYLQRADATLDTLVSGETTMEYRMCGKGDDTLLLVHGFGPVPHVQWEHQIKLLSDSAVLVIPNLIYFDASTSTSGEYSPYFQADQLARLLDHLSIEKVHVAGLSYGGLVSTLFSQRYANRMHSLILIDALNPYYSQATADSIAQSFQKAHITELLIPQDAEAVKEIFSITYYKPQWYPKSIRKKVVRQLYSNQVDHKKELLYWLEKNESKLKSANLVFDFNVTLIWGKEDQIIPLYTGHEFAQNHGATIHVISKTGHVANMEAPEITNSIIKTVLQSAE